MEFEGLSEKKTSYTYKDSYSASNIKTMFKQSKVLYNMVCYIPAMATTIQVSTQLLGTLKKRKQYDKESYEEVIWNLVEDTKELSEETKKQIEQARADIKAGKSYTHEQVKKKLGL